MRRIEAALLVACVGVCLTAQAELLENQPEAFTVTPAAVVGGVGGLAAVPQRARALPRGGEGAASACKHLETAVGEICAKQGTESSVCKAVQRARHSGCAASTAGDSIGEGKSKSSWAPASPKEKLRDLWQEANELSMKQLKEKEQVFDPYPAVRERRSSWLWPVCFALVLSSAHQR